ncbi:MAG TPA: hypothetical protein EYM79_06405, partial [Planctomycetes bacterium]|nr:hypothetical protein [Planctomycetota bacterium]
MARMFSHSTLASKHPSLFFLAILPILLACGCTDDSTETSNVATGDPPNVNQPVPAEPRPADNAAAITKIEDMYGEVFKADDGIVNFVDFGGAFGESVDLSVLSGVPYVERLVLNGASVSDDDLVHLKDLKHLKILDLGETRVSDAGMLTLKSVKSLEEINLQRTDITDAGFGHLLELPKLRRFKMVRCKISDAGLALVKDRTDIIVLDLKECINVSDVGLAHLAGVKDLKFLRVWGSQITDQGVADLVGLTKLV